MVNLPIMLEEKLLYPANYSIRGLDLFEEKLTSFKINTNFEGKTGGWEKEGKMRNERPRACRATARPCAMGRRCSRCTPPHPSSCGSSPISSSPLQLGPGWSRASCQQRDPACLPNYLWLMHPHPTLAPSASQNRSPLDGLSGSRFTNEFHRL